MPNARPTPGLRLTPERRVEIRHAIKHNPEVDAQDALDLLHDLDVLERQRDEARREVERLRERLDALAAHFDAEASFAYDGWQEEKDDYLEGVYRALNRAAEEIRALAERGGEG